MYMNVDRDKEEVSKKHIDGISTDISADTIGR